MNKSVSPLQDSSAPLSSQFPAPLAPSVARASRSPLLSSKSPPVETPRDTLPSGPPLFNPGDLSDIDPVALDWNAGTDGGGRGGRGGQGRSELRGIFSHSTASEPASPSLWRSRGDRNGTPTTIGASLGDDSEDPQPTTRLSSSGPTRTPVKRKFALDIPTDRRAPLSEPPRKRAKPPSRIRESSGAFSLSASAYDSRAFQPPSPLFFSHSPRLRPALPARFSSSEAAAKMLSKARAEDSHVSRVSLPYGTVPATDTSPTSHPHSSTPQYYRRSLERNLTGRSNSPDVGSHGRKDFTGGLNSIGMVELLEQDNRPTFIVDLADSTNYGPGPLNPVFMNSSLKSCEGLQATVCGASVDATTPNPNDFLQFKSWLLSATVNGESLNVCLPPLTFADVTWSCSTLRKRLRIVAGAFTSPAPTAVAAMRVSVPPSDSSFAKVPLEKVIEPMDYFGPDANGQSLANAISDGSDSTVTEAVPTIEVSSGGRSDGVFSSLIPSREGDLSGSTDLLPSLTTYVPDSPFSGQNTSIPSDSSRIVDPTTNLVGRNSRISMVSADSPSFDWTRLPVSDKMPPHIRFARSIDWAATSLGPIDTWTSDLRQMCNLIMASPHPAAMYFGPDLIAIYNEAYILLAGQKHPTLMGMSYREAWAEIWDDVADVFDSAWTTGEATMKDDDCLFMRRSDDLEETYFSWSIIPMIGRDGSVMGLYNPAFEKTRRKIAERRMLTLREVGERTATARDVKAFWSQVLGSFEFNEHDSPFLLLYSATEEHDSDSSSMHSNSVMASRQCMLEGALGVPVGHPAAPESIDFKSGMEGFGPVFREVMKTDKPLLLHTGSDDMPAYLVEGLEQRGFGDPIKAVVVCPIHPTTGEGALGFLVLGVNTRRPYDDDYSLFVQLLSRQLATSLASVVLFEEEIRRGQKAAKLAALDRIELSEQLAAKTREAIDGETRFSRMAEFAPVGMFIANSEGQITFANETWYEISQVPKSLSMADSWINAVNEEDIGLVKSLWKDIVVEKKSVSNEFRFKAQWNRNGNSGDTWVLFSCYPERYDDGRLKSIFGSITDISDQKWAEGIQKRKMEEAVELKRQQENFIDITSHEMRNPLSAILQCSDEITASLTKYRQGAGRVLPDEVVANCLDAAQTINLCSQHQKRIVDDILTLSKLDSQLLLVTPVDTQPLTVVQRALKMHEGELQAADIQMRFVVDKTFRDLQLDWVRCDPSRVLQVLINLTTNAIKFTGTESKRTITVTIAASKERPSGNPDAPVKYFPTRSKNRDLLSERDWGDGDKVYIHFAVCDTGRGLSPEEKKLLFIRFSQASPRTHVQYGGSGLGLFISRELTELQGGEIGVESEAGKGSTFAFYIAARRSISPAEGNGSGSGGGTARSEPQRRKSIPTAPVKPLATHAPAKVLTRQDMREVDVNKVLIVEDNLVNQKVLQKQLKNLGTVVHVANHGGEALEKLRQSTYWRGAPPDGLEKIDIGVVLMDQEMPVMDGLTCTRKIRELEAEGKLVGHVPIIAVTANARPEQVQTALDAGMDDVVSKPFRIPELMPKIEELMLRYPLPTTKVASGA